MKRSVWLSLSPYGYEVLLYKGSWKQLAAYMRTKNAEVGEDPRCAAAHVHMVNGGHQFSIIWMPYWESSITNHGALVHECIHACAACLEHTDVVATLKTGDHEALTYLVEDLYKQCAYNLGTFNQGTLDKHLES